jgi:hypothetical protein
VNTVLLDAGNNGAAYLHLNGCHDSAASLTMTATNKVLTDSAAGVTGELIVEKLSATGVAKLAGTYAAATLGSRGGLGTGPWRGILIVAQELPRLHFAARR